MRAVAEIPIGVLRILEALSAGEERGLRVVAHAVRPRVVDAEADAARRPALGGQSERVIFLRADSLVALNRPNQPGRLRILERQLAALIQVRRGRARWIKRAGERARTKAEKHAGVYLHLAPEPVGVAAEITG